MKPPRFNVMVRHAPEMCRWEVVVQPPSETHEVVAAHFQYSSNKDDAMHRAHIYATGVRFGLNYKRTIHGKQG